LKKTLELENCPTMVVETWGEEDDAQTSNSSLKMNGNDEL